MFAFRCTCLNWEPASIHSPQVKRAAEHVVATVNNMTLPHAGLCARLRLDDVMSAVRYVTNDHVLRFKDSADRDGRVPDLSDKMKPNIVRLFPPFSAVYVYCARPVN